MFHDPSLCPFVDESPFHRFAHHFAHCNSYFSFDRHHPCTSHCCSSKRPCRSRVPCPLSLCQQRRELGLDMPAFVLYQQPLALSWPRLPWHGLPALSLPAPPWTEMQPIHCVSFMCMYEYRGRHTLGGSEAALAFCKSSSREIGALCVISPRLQIPKVQIILAKMSNVPFIVETPIHGSFRYSQEFQMPLANDSQR